MQNILTHLLNRLKKPRPYTLEPEHWVDLYCDDFYEKAYILTEDHKTALDIVEITFLTSALSLDDYNKDISERSWLLKFLKQHLDEYLMEFDVTEILLHPNKHSVKTLSDKETEAFKCKTLYNEDTPSICEQLKISENDFWDLIGNSRTALIKTMT